uniref:DUF7036 domain-containing protein n=1 Tax=Arundo donax TaxID=35708 RepID=A0A0A9EU94_ARUDO
MKAGLLLNSYENLYIKLTNSQGSTILPPTIVEASIVLEVGNHQPSVPRMKQLARTITNSSSSAGNLGLNNTVFGRVKQISLSSYLKHSLHSGGGSDAPSPAPMHHHGHHRHHHRHHGHDTNRHLAPAPAPIHFPVPQPRYSAPPSGCPYGINKPKKRGPITPATEPGPSDHRSASPASPPHPSSPSPASYSPHDPSMHGGSPVPSPPVLPEPPLPTVSFAHAHPPSERQTRTSPATSEQARRAGPAGMSQVAPAPHSSYATGTRDVPCCWVLFAAVTCILIRLL